MLNLFLYRFRYLPSGHVFRSYTREINDSSRLVRYFAEVIYKFRLTPELIAIFNTSERSHAATLRCTLAKREQYKNLHAT